MLYQLHDCTVSFGQKIVLSHIEFEIRGSEKIALVGRNGAGKTTLLKVLTGEITPDRDDKRHGPAVLRSRDFSIGMLSQTMPEEEGGLKSGGEKTRNRILELLAAEPDLLLLDEPTNHLDTETTEWLERHLKKYSKAVVLVSHDRFFLDRIADIVYEAEEGSLKRYPGNYTFYREEKKKCLRIEQGKYNRQQKEIKRLTDLIERFKNKPTKAAMTRSKEKYLERMEVISKPQADETRIITGEIRPVNAGPGKVWEAQHLKVGYDRELYEITMKIRRGQKIALIGPNGSGKTALLKTIAGYLPPYKGSPSGCMRRGNGVTIGYFDQQSAEIESSLHVAEHYHRLFPSLPEKEVRSELGRYLFGGRLAEQTVSSLSGGEKARLVLAEILKEAPNFLILDEPTNHMDIPAKETMESAFLAYTGTILFVSHDRYFISRVAKSILTLEKDKVMYYPFGYEHYLEHRGISGSDELAAKVSAEEEALIAGIRAVPKAERIRLREIPEEEAGRDWEKRLSWEKCEQERINYERTLFEPEAGSGDAEVALKKWTEALIEWDEN